VREYREIFGAVEPLTGNFVYMIEEKEEPIKRKVGRPRKGEVVEIVKPKPKEKGWKSRLMNNFLQLLSDSFPDDHIVVCLDRASWHDSQYTIVPNNMTLIPIPAYTPEMNPIEQLWREIRTRGFHNKYFHSIKDVVTNLHSTIADIPSEVIQSITQRSWFMVK